MFCTSWGRFGTSWLTVSLGAVLYGCALLVPAVGTAATINVQIIKPTDQPTFTFRLGQEYEFEAVAFIEGVELEGGQVTWDWDFGDTTPHSPNNPTTHTYLYSRNFTVTVTASYQGMTGQATINAAAAGGGVIDGLELVASPDAGGEVCDYVAVMATMPDEVVRQTGARPLWADFYVWQNDEWVWVDSDGFQSEEFEGTWYETALALWDTIPFPNHEAVTWRVDYYLEVGPPPGEEPAWVIKLSKTASWTPHNTVLAVDGDPIIVHKVGETSHSVAFTIDHLKSEEQDIDPKYHVTLEVSDLQGNHVATVTKDDVEIGDDTIVWVPEFTPPGGEPPGDLQDTNAIYTFRLTVDHGMCSDTWPSTATQFSGNLDLSGVTFNPADLRIEGPIKGPMTRLPGRTDIIIYPPDLENPTRISGGAGGSNPVDGIPIGIDVPGDKMGDWIVVTLPVDDDEAGEGNPAHEPRPAPPKGGTVRTPVATYGFQGTGSLLNDTKKMLEKAAEEQRHPSEGAEYSSPAYSPALNIINSAQAKVSYDRFAGAETTNRDAIIFFVGHGDPGILYVQRIGGKEELGWHRLYAGSGENNETRDVYFLPNLTPGCLSRCQLVLLVACDTAKTNPPNVPVSCTEAFRSLGAGCAIGSCRTIFAEESRTFSDTFWESAMRGNNTAHEALLDALDQSGMSDFDWLINGSTGPLRPARYR